MALDMFGKDIRLLDQDELDMLDDEYHIKKGRPDYKKVVGNYARRWHYNYAYGETRTNRRKYNNSYGYV